MKRAIFFIFIFIFQVVFSQTEEVKWLKLKPNKVAVLEQQLEETSALNFLEHQLFTLNDSGNAAELYEISPENGKILQTIPINHVQNIDWEALTNDGNNIYIGDFGNNAGTRTDLKIYKVSLPSYNSMGAINFYYPEQKEFSKKPLNNNFDAESLVYANGNLHLFTKEWKSHQTSHYIIPTEPSDIFVPARKTEQFNLGYVATDAAYFQKKLYIVGYKKNMDIYLTIFEEDDAGNFFLGKHQKYYLGSTLFCGQVEGISVNEKGIYISGEKFSLKPFQVQQRLYFIPKEKL